MEGSSAGSREGLIGVVSTKAIFLITVVVTVLLSFLNAQSVYKQVVPSTDLGHNGTELISLLSKGLTTSTTSLAIAPTYLPNWQSNFTRSILFVHVGKAGGETIKSILAVGCQSKRNKKYRNSCLGKLPNSSLSDAVTRYTHCFMIGRRAAPDSTSYLYNLRHPVDRTVSWYYYVSPKNCYNETRGSPSCKTANFISNNPKEWEGLFFDRCFRTVEELAQTLVVPLGKPPPAHSPRYNCPRMVRQTLQGHDDPTQHEVTAHMVANFRYYTNVTIARFPKKEVLVVRTDHMWEDLVHLDQLLGGDGTFGELHGSSVTHGSHKNKHRKAVSDEGFKLLCCGLQDEMKIHNYLLSRAVNLDEASKEESMRNTLTRCGVSSWVELRRDCGSLLPW